MNFINNLNHLDILVLIITIISMFYGYARGLVKETSSIISIFLSGYLSTIMYPEISTFLKKYIDMILIADAISFITLFILIYSTFSIIGNLLTTNINKTPLKVFNKNFGIIFGFFRSLLILSLLNIITSWTIWKDSYPIWFQESKSMILINYSSKKLLDIFPETSLNKTKKVFGLSTDASLENFFKKNSIDKYNEPIINRPSKGITKGYTDNDNESLNKLFNIESAE